MDFRAYEKTHHFGGGFFWGIPPFFEEPPRNGEVAGNMTFLRGKLVKIFVWAFFFGGFERPTQRAPKNICFFLNAGICW